MLHVLPQEHLTDAQVAYRFSQAAGYALLGDEEAFVLLLQDIGDKKHVALYGDICIAHEVSFESHAAQDALKMAYSLNAEFRVIPGAVVCKVGDAITVGASYTDAAMKAVVRYWGK